MLNHLPFKKAIQYFNNLVTSLPGPTPLPTQDVKGSVLREPSEALTMFSAQPPWSFRGYTLYITPPSFQVLSVFWPKCNSSNILKVKKKEAMKSFIFCGISPFL